jgi:WhiB family redox-sensing transcriptional regulator
VTATTEAPSTTVLRCDSCDRPMFRKRTPVENRPAGSVSVGGRGLCTTCYQSIHTIGQATVREAKAPAKPAAREPHADISWHAVAACNDPDIDPELFFHPEGETGAAKEQRIATAVAICETCPAMQLCRQDALDRRDAYGIRGGLSEDERAAILAGGSAPNARLYLEPVRLHGETRSADTGPVSAHIQALVDAGFSVTSVSRFAGVSVETVRSILSGGRRTIKADTAEKLLSVKARAVAA